MNLAAPEGYGWCVVEFRCCLVRDTYVGEETKEQVEMIGSKAPRGTQQRLCGECMLWQRIDRGRAS